MTSKQLITVIILIVSFGVILFFWSMFNWQGDINRETCQTSVVLRASATFKDFQFRENIPLKCQTDIICFKNGLFSKGCNIQGENVRKVGVGSKDELLDFISEDIYSWYKTLGEGKVNFMERGLTTQKYCFINSIYSLDENTKKQIESEGGITYKKLFEYFETKQTDRGTNYFQEIYKIKTTGDYFNEFESFKKTNSNVKFNLDDKINFSDNNALITQTISIGTGKSVTIGLIAVIAAVAAPFTGASSLVAGGVAIAALGSGSYVAYWYLPDPNYPIFIPPQIVKYDAKTLSDLRCTSFESLA
jgi:hypothetical protein